jgi:hypothetical protein
MKNSKEPDRLGQLTHRAFSANSGSSEKLENILSVVKAPYHGFFVGFKEIA